MLKDLFKMTDGCRVVIASGDPVVALRLRDAMMDVPHAEVLYRRGVSLALDAFEASKQDSEAQGVLVITFDELARAPTATRQRLEALRATIGLRVIGGRTTGCALPSFIRPMIDDVLPYPFDAEELDLRLRLLREFHLARAKAELADSLLRGVAEAVMLTDREDRIVFVNEAFEAMTGYACDEVVGRTPRFLRAEQDGEPDGLIPWREAQLRGEWKGEVRNRRKSGEVYAEWLSISVLRDASQGAITHHLSILTDITEQKIRMEKLHLQAQHDVLTGLPNRILLADRFGYVLAAARRNRRQVALLFVDLDGFKPINDRHGHGVGDVVLKTIAQRLVTTVRGKDTVCRHGGDEFVCLLADLADVNEAVAIAEKLLKAVMGDIVLGAQTFAVGASIGIAIAPAQAEMLDDLVNKADAAMYLAKRAGGNRACMHQTRIEAPN